MYFFIFMMVMILIILKQGWAGKAFWLPGTGREIENHIFLREKTCFTGRERELENATGREGNGKFEACIPGNPGKSRESYKKQG